MEKKKKKKKKTKKNTLKDRGPLSRGKQSKFKPFFSGFSFTTIHESLDYKGRGRAFL